MARNKKIVIMGVIILLVGIPVGIYYFLFSGPERELEIERIVIKGGKKGSGTFFVNSIVWLKACQEPHA